MTDLLLSFNLEHAINDSRSVSNVLLSSKSLYLLGVLDQVIATICWARVNVWQEKGCAKHKQTGQSSAPIMSVLTDVGRFKEPLAKSRAL